MADFGHFSQFKSLSENTELRSFTKIPQEARKLEYEVACANKYHARNLNDNGYVVFSIWSLRGSLDGSLYRSLRGFFYWSLSLNRGKIRSKNC